MASNLLIEITLRLQQDVANSLGMAKNLMENATNYFEMAQHFMARCC